MPKSRRCCAFLQCSNGEHKLEKWRFQNCDIHNCNKGTGSCICDPPFTLFTFPTELKDPEGRQKWTSIVNRKKGNKIWHPTSDSRVCSVHFADGNPTAANPYPSLHLGYETRREIKARPPPTPRENLDHAPKKCRKFQNINTNCNINISEKSITEHAISSKKDDCSDALPLDLTNGDHSYSLSNIQTESIELKRLRNRVKNLEKELSKSKTMVNDLLRKPFQIQSILKSDKKVKFYTGIPTLASFLKIESCMSRYFRNIRYWKGPSKVSNPVRYKRYDSRVKRILTHREEFIMTLMKLRLGALNEDLADRFGISCTQVSNVFTTWIKFLSKFLGSLVFNPAKEVVRDNLPPSFRNPKFCRARHIIDCTEVFIEKPNNLQVQTLTWSEYKHHHTAKILISITPAGMINFVSKTWGGRTSDKYVTLNSGFLDLIEDYDIVLADRGFPIREELALLRAELLVPPGRRGVSQMSVSDVRTTEVIAKRRIYVEQAIRRLKCFRILKYELPLTLLHHLDDIVLIASGICNLYPPLAKFL
ncbi:hypothetical protein SNE40_019789 [Patella caerulea]|uniref:THAP-type domain-containing protein n=1 Tax=Patella caerulea TaxID=87958 RepID=A0AAN8IZX1_PATCE